MTVTSDRLGGVESPDAAYSPHGIIRQWMRLTAKRINKSEAAANEDYIIGSVQFRRRLFRQRPLLGALRSFRDRAGRRPRLPLQSFSPLPMHVGRRGSFFRFMVFHGLTTSGGRLMLRLEDGLGLRPKSRLVVHRVAFAVSSAAQYDRHHSCDERADDDNDRHGPRPPACQAWPAALAPSHGPSILPCDCCREVNCESAKSQSATSAATAQ